MTTEQSAQALEWLQVGHQKFIATDSDGKVVGKVEQRVLDLRWDVSTNKEHLGEYLTLEHGKAAVEKAHQPAAAQLAGLREALELCESVLSDLPSTQKQGTKTRHAWQVARDALKIITQPKEPTNG